MIWVRNQVLPIHVFNILLSLNPQKSSKKEENVKEENTSLTAKEGKIRLPGKEEIFYRSWEEGNESDPWVVVDFKIVKK